MFAAFPSVFGECRRVTPLLVLPCWVGFGRKASSRLYEGKKVRRALQKKVRRSQSGYEQVTREGSAPFEMPSLTLRQTLQRKTENISKASEIVNDY